MGWFPKTADSQTQFGNVSNGNQMQMPAVDEIDFAVGLNIRQQEMALALCTDNGIMADSCGMAVSTRNGID